MAMFRNLLAMTRRPYYGEVPVFVPEQDLSWIPGALDPTEMGAAGDGARDDTVAIQRAVDAAVAAGGGRVFIPPGSYKTTTAVTITGDNVEICGAGRSTKIYPSHTSGSTFNFTSNTVGSRNTLRDLYIQSTNGGGTRIDVLVDKQNAFLAENVYSYTPGYGLWVTDNSANYAINVRGCSFGAIVHEGIVQAGGAGLYIFDCILTGGFGSQSTAGFHIRKTGGTQIALSECGNTGYGLLVDPGNGEAVLSLNSISNYYDSCTYDGISFQPSGTGYIQMGKSVGDWSATHGRYGLQVVGKIHGFLFSGLQVVGSRKHGILIDGGDIEDVEIDGVQCAGNGFTRSGTCNTVSATKTVTFAAGNNGGWQDYMVGDTITIAGSPYTIASVLSSTVLTVSTDPGTATGAAWSYGSAGAYQGIVLGANTNRVRIRGGQSGQFGYYTNSQGYGVFVSSGTGDYVQVEGIDCHLNATAALASGATGTHNLIQNVAGYNPVGPLAITPDVSGTTTVGPYPTPATVYIYGGTVSDVKLGGVSVATASPCTMKAAANQTVVITHSDDPTIVANVE